MKKLIQDFALQLEDAVSIGEKASIDQPSNSIENVVISGLGGSGIGGSIIQAILRDTCKVPIEVNKSYNTPAYVNEHTLFIACSFSGNTEETINCVNSVLDKAHIVAITSGGELQQIVEKNNLSYITIPGESKCPRANLGYSLIQLYYVLHYLGLIDEGFKDALNNSIALINNEQNNMIADAKAIAKSLKDKLPIIYCGATLLPIAIRFQHQINENGKQLCHVNVFSEMNHNELVGWVNPVPIYEHAKVVYLHSNYDNARETKRMEICRSIFENKTSEVLDINAKGETLLEQVFYLIHLTDWVSFFLAELNNVDPFPVTAIDNLKAELLK